MKTHVVRDLFLKFMGLTFISGLITTTWQAALSITSMGMMGSAVPSLVIALSGLLVVVEAAIFGLLAWLFLFRTDTVARALWPNARTVGNQPLPDDGALTVGFIVLLFGLWLLIPGLAALMAAVASVYVAQDAASWSMGTLHAFARNWIPILQPLSSVLIGAICVRWPHRIESLIVRSWETKPIFHIDLDDGDGDGESDEPDDDAPS